MHTQSCKDVHTAQVLPAGGETESNRDCPGGDTAVNMDWPGPYRNSGPYTCSFILFITEAKQEYIVQSTSVLRQMSGGIFL